MIGMIRRYLKGRAMIIAKRQLAQGAKKVARSVKDRDSKKKDATKGIKMIVSRVQARVLAVIVSIGIIFAPPLAHLLQRELCTTHNHSHNLTRSL